MMSWHQHNLGHLKTAALNVSTLRSVEVKSGRRRTYLEGEGVNHLAELIRLVIKGGGPVEQTPAAEHHPAWLQLFISTVHKPPTQTQLHL